MVVPLSLRTPVQLRSSMVSLPTEPPPERRLSSGSIAKSEDRVRESRMNFFNGSPCSKLTYLYIPPPHQKLLLILLSYEYLNIRSQLTKS